MIEYQATSPATLRSARSRGRHGADPEVEVRVAPAGLRDHLRREVDAAHGQAQLGQRSGDPTGTAAHLDDRTGQSGGEPGEYQPLDGIGPQPGGQHPGVVDGDGVVGEPGPFEVIDDHGTDRNADLRHRC